MKKQTLATMIIIFVILLLLFIVIDLFNPQQVQVTPPKSDNGVIDVSNWDFNEQGNVKLDGYWGFYPNRLLTPAEMTVDSLQPEQYIKVPKGWSNKETYGFMKDKGVGTYRLQVKANPSIPLYGIKTTYIRNASKIYIDGEQIGNSGNPMASSDEGYESRNIPYSMFFSPEGDSFVITIQVANLDFYYGGIIQSIYLGTPDNILHQGLKTNMLDIMGISFLLLSAIYYFGIYMKRPQDKSFLYFAAFCFGYTFVVATSSERIFMQLYSMIPYMTVLKIKMIIISLCMICLCLFIREMGKVYIPKLFMKSVVISMLTMSVLGLIVPIKLYSMFDATTVFVDLVVFLSIAVFMTKAIILKQYGRLTRRSALLLLVGMLLNLIQLVTMMLYLYSIINTNIVPILTLLFFLLGIAIMFAEQYSRAYNDLELMSSKLIETDKIKDEFLIHTSHEFKTPLHGIINLAQVVIDQSKSEITRKQGENLSYIIALATRLSTLVNDIIDFQSLQNRSLTFHNRIFDINGAVQATIETLKVMRKGEDIKLVNRIPVGMYYLFTDEHRFIQIIVNLIGNALKFTDKGIVEIKANSRAGFIHITVLDTGAGMDEEVQKQIFGEDPYVVGGDSSEYRSSGLGLKISKLLSSHMGGDLELVWSVPDKGSIFELVLPEANDMQRVEHMEVRDAIVMTEARPPSPEHNSHRASTRRVNTEEDTSKIKVLLVDDEPSNIIVLQELFASDIYQTLVAYNGASALELIQEHRDISLVLLDVMMPGLSGYEVCKRIRADHPIYKLPILLLTVRNSPADIAAGLEAGANDFLVKPFDSKEFMARVTTLLQLKEAVHNAIKMESLFLQSQINPHFIYNVLSIIMSLCYSDGERARNLLGEFSNYLRMSFDLDPHHSEVSLKRELSLVQSYITLEQARFGERLRVEMHIDEELLQEPILALTIQPLVENAIRHGLMKRISGGTVAITAQSSHNGLQIVIKDDGVGMPTDQLGTALTADHPSGSVGLINVHKRLLNEYGQGLHIVSEEGSGTTVTFCIPVRIKNTSVGDVQ